ncbi:MAG: LptA/OstA family protein [Asticcacaulis sp.]
MKKGLISAALAAMSVGAMISLGGSAGAQISNENVPVSIDGDSMQVDQNARTQIFDGRVEVIQGTARLRADNVKVVYEAGPDGSGFGDAATITASGNVYYVTPDNTVKGDLAVYTKSTDDMVITGDVILTQGQNVLTGNRLVSGVTSGITTLDANPTSTGKGRVKAIIYPDKKTAPAKPAGQK